MMGKWVIRSELTLEFKLRQDLGVDPFSIQEKQVGICYEVGLRYTVVVLPILPVAGLAYPMWMPRLEPRERAHQKSDVGRASCKPLIEDRPRAATRMID